MKHERDLMDYVFAVFVFMLLALCAAMVVGTWKTVLQ